MATSTTNKPKKPAKTKATWKTSVQPTVSKNYKVWMIVMTAAVAVLTIAIVILVVALVIMVGDARHDMKAEASTGKSDSKSDDTNPANEEAEVDISGLDKSKLLTAADVGAEEIPDHYIGNKDARVVVIEYEDFACLHCQHLAADAEQIHADYKDRVLFIHRSFSLGFPNSEKTLRAAEAAYQLGGEKAYWAMAKLLYQDAKWTNDEPFGAQGILNGYARQIGLDASEFKKAMSNKVSANKIARDKELGVAAGVGGTPTWFVNGQQIMPRDADIRAALDAAL